VIRDWLEETHGTAFELLRHFLLRFFDSDLITHPGQTASVLAGAFGVAAPWFPMFGPALAHKYGYFASLGMPEPFRQAVRADELWLITLMMSAVGLLTAIKWQSLFPGLRDYRALGSLPLRASHIFRAKLAALLIVTTAVVLTLNALPSVMFPAISGGRWAFTRSLAARIEVYAIASCAGCYFFFFALVALQGVLLNLLRPRAFARVTGSVQGLLVAAMLVMIVLSFSVGPATPAALIRAGAGRWLPPLWFVGLCQTMMGDPDPVMHVLASRAQVGLPVAMAVALLSYLICYGRHRTLLVEGVAGPAKDRKWPSAALEFLIPDARQQAVIVFMTKTLGRSSHHRMVLMGYCGFAGAIVTTAILGIRGTVDASRAAPAAFIYAHVILLAFLLIGIRHLFSIPTELKANWIFQLTEGEGRSTWLRAVDRFVLVAGAAAILVLPFPMEARLVGWRGFAEATIFAALALLCYNWMFSEWEKLPFTCSQLPGKTPGWILVLYLLGLLTAIPILNALLLATLYNSTAYLVVSAIFIVAWTRLRKAREESWGDLRLKYEEAPEPAVHGLNLPVQLRERDEPRPSRVHETWTPAPIPPRAVEAMPRYGGGFVLFQDIRFGLRALAGARGFTAVALISLSLGIGVATSAFSELNGFVLRDVPAVRKPGELVLLAAPVSYPDYKRYRDRTDLFSGVTAYAAPIPFGVAAGAETQRVWGHLVTPSYFPALGVNAQLGRVFQPEERAANVIVSDRFWHNRLGADPEIVGKPLRVNGHLCTIVGVTPPDFQGASPMVYEADLWLPVEAGPGLAPELGGNAMERPDRALFHVVARLRPGVTQASAEAALDVVARQIAEEAGEPQHQQKSKRAILLPGGKLMPVRKQDLPFLTGFFAVLGGMILLIASSNVANMTLARATDRRREIAIRLALGAGRRRIIRQLLTESLLVATGAAVVGYGFACVLMGAASREKLPYPMPLKFHLEPDGRVLVFTILLTLFTAVAFGLLPALQATRTEITPALKEGGDVRIRRFRRLSMRNVLVVSQVAGSLALLLITGFLVLGHRKIVGGEPGFDPQRLYLVSVDPVRDGYSGERAADFFHKLLERVKGLPSIANASAADAVPMTMVGKPGVTFALGEGGVKSIYGARRYAVGRDFLDTMGIPILRGRGFRKGDETGDTRVAIVSEKFMVAVTKGQDPVGRQIEIGNEGLASFTFGGDGQGPRNPLGQTQTFQIVGVARNVRDGLSMVATDGPPVIYVPLRPAAYAGGSLGGITLVVRAIPGVDAVAAVQREIAAMDDRLKPYSARAMTDQIDELLFPVQVALWTYGLIGIFGLILAAVGLAGVTAYSVVQRRREIGIRMALGASLRDVLGLVMKEGAVLIAVGSIIGIAAARVGVRALSSVLASIAVTSGQSASDPVLLIGAPVLLALLALVSCYVPARKTSEIDPAIALRAE
jgi:predicted permease